MKGRCEVSSFSPLIPDELVACIGAGRDPTASEVSHLAERVLLDGAAERSAFLWGQLPADSVERRLCVRAAHLALEGDDGAR